MDVTHVGSNYHPLVCRHKGKHLEGFICSLEEGSVEGSSDVWAGVAVQVGCCLWVQRQGLMHLGPRPLRSGCQTAEAGGISEGDAIKWKSAKLLRDWTLLQEGSVAAVDEEALVGWHSQEEVTGSPIPPLPVFQALFGALYWQTGEVADRKPGGNGEVFAESQPLHHRTE